MKEIDGLVYTDDCLVLKDFYIEKIPKKLVMVPECKRIDLLHESIFNIDSDSLEEIVFSEGLENIPGYLLNGSRNLSIVRLPKELNSIGCEAFARTDSLKEIVFPEMLVTIKAEAFRK